MSGKALFAVGIAIVIILAAVALRPGSAPSCSEARAETRTAKVKCTGLTTQRLNERIVRLYRVFEDGTVEAWDDGEGSESREWARIGK